MEIIVAAYCYKKKGENHRMVLVTSSTGRWIIPKGQVDEDLTKREVALSEAWEEAGVKGVISSKSKDFLIDRGGLALWKIYPVKIISMAEEWPEQRLRTRELLPPSEAASKIDNIDLAKAILKLAKKYQSS